MAASQEVLRLWALYEKVCGASTSKNKSLLTLPRYISIAKKCVEHKIQDTFITKSHFNDLYMLIMSIDITNLKTAIRQRKANSAKGQAYKTRDISQSDAVKFLKGGGMNGE